ncbi:M48 family metallopeptidase [Jannaschia sp. M317]|uniref:M48 family metallopeptidase n=1 Tax=Jannaschia sp. M317 TaxID=2867011 RepID=UPI0021A486DD|nr:M48 family metallopeptidase [Jannaschia sp. M317]UWQ17362.1 M48 family metallopeptidase [Jannaschia sp. M317]
MSIWGTGPARPDAAPAEQHFGDYFDGIRALRQRVLLSHEDGARGRVLLLGLPDGGQVRWPLRRIRHLPDLAGGERVMFGLANGDPARLLLTDRDARIFVEEMADEARAPLPGPPLWRRAALVAAGGVTLLAVLILVVLPALAALLARFMNPDAEVAMGQLHYEQTQLMFGDGFTPLRECSNPAGQVALRALTDRVAQGVDLPYDLHVTVLDDSANPILNAYAVAGGRIAFFNSMIQQAARPEEIAAVLAHELGHVVNDDPVRHQLQVYSGLAIASVLIGDVSGGGVLSGAAGQALTSSYSRRAETAADAFAHDQLTAVGLPPSALGEMFERLRARYGDAEGLLAHLSSHPQLADRIARATGVGDPVIGAPALTPKAWGALRAICG